MKLKNGKFKYDAAYVRSEFAQILSLIISPASGCLPYMPNEGDDTFWRVDLTGNNWTLKFNKEDDFTTFYIQYRYNSTEPGVEKALFNWLKVKRSNLELIED